MPKLGHDLVAQLHRFGPRRGVELAGQEALHALELLKGRTQVARLHLFPHEGDVGFLIRRVEREQVLPTLGLTKQQLVPQSQPFMHVVDPRLIEIMRKQIPREEVQRGSRRGRRPVAEGRLGGGVERQCVHLHVDSGQQGHDITTEHDGVVAAKHPSRVVRRLVEPGRGLLDAEIRPQTVDHPVSMQLVAGAEREELHQRGCMASRPGGGGDLPSVDLDAEVTQEPDRC